MLSIEAVSTETEITHLYQDLFDSEIDNLDNQGSSAIQSVVFHSPPTVTMKTPEDHRVNQQYRDAADSESSNTQDDRSVVASEADSLPTGAVATKEPVTEGTKLKKHAINVKKRIAKKNKIRARKIEQPQIVQINKNVSIVIARSLNFIPGITEVLFKMLFKKQSLLLLHLEIKM